MPALSFPFTEDGKPLGAKFTEKGCIVCPAGSAYSGDVALGALERVTNQVLMEGFKDYQVPVFPLANLPVREAGSQNMSVRSRTRQHVFYPDVHRTKFHDPMPSVNNFGVTRELLQQCGNSLAEAQLIANSNSLGCAPPRGSRGISGKDRYYSEAATAVFELGPFCVTSYLDIYDFGAALEAYKKAAVRASGMSLEYEKIRRYIAMSRRNASAVAGTRQAKFFDGKFGEMPTSPGTIEWVLNAIDTGIGGEIAPGADISIRVSHQLLKYWQMKYAKDHGLDTNFFVNPGAFRKEVEGFATQWEDGNFTMRSLRTNRKVTFVTQFEPIYIETYPIGEDASEWDFQRYYTTELGDDTMEGAANGYRQSKNTAYGDPAAVAACEGVPKRLAEMLFVYTDKAFHYEAFPTNPLGKLITGVETNLQRLWGGTGIEWFTGTEVDLYFLNTINKHLEGTGAPCFNNRDKTWFAGLIKTGLQFIEDDPRQMMTLLVQVPFEYYTLEASDVLPDAGHPDPIDLTPRPPQEPDLCSVLPDDAEAPVEGPGCFMVPAKLQYTLPSSGTKQVLIPVVRVNGAAGTLALPHQDDPDTALQGTHYSYTDGTLSFAAGETLKYITVTLNAVLADGDEESSFVQFEIVWDNDPEVLCDGQVTRTTVCLALASPASDPAALTTCADPVCGNCPPQSS